MGVATGCGCKEVYISSYYLSLLLLYLFLFYSSIPTFCSFLYIIMLYYLLYYVLYYVLYYELYFVLYYVFYDVKKFHSEVARAPKLASQLPRVALVLHYFYIGVVHPLWGLFDQKLEVGRKKTPIFPRKSIIADSADDYVIFRSGAGARFLLVLPQLVPSHSYM